MALKPKLCPPRKLRTLKLNELLMTKSKRGGAHTHTKEKRVKNRKHHEYLDETEE